MPLDIAFVTTYPPDRGNMAEYAFYLTQALAALPEIGHVHIVANEAGSAPRKEVLGPKLTVHRMWKMDSVPSLLALPAKVRALNVDVTHFNTHIRCWGPSREASFAGAALIPLFRALVSNVVITMHTIGDAAQQKLHKEIGLATRLGIHVANKMYLQADHTIVMLRSMQATLEREYSTKSAVHLPHGSYGARVAKIEPPQLRVLCFGFWGAFKDADQLVSAVRVLRERGLPAELVLGGGAHPYHPEIYQQMRERYAKDSFVRFTGYVPEAEIGALFESAGVVVLPYRNNSGASGVLNLARSYGRAVMISADGGLMEQVRDEGGAALVFSSQAALIDGLQKVLSNHTLHAHIASANLEVARRLSIDAIAPRIAQLYEKDAVPVQSPMTPPIQLSVPSEESLLWPPVAQSA
jgi:glycosyltransferase involved in cell wall biosynthesis